MRGNTILRPGIYTNGSLPARTLIKTLGSTCVYTHDAPDSILNRPHQCGRPDGVMIRTTPCSSRTFLAAMGAPPAREFSTAEAKLLTASMVSQMPYRKCNLVQRKLFFPKGSRCKIRDEAVRAA